MVTAGVFLLVRTSILLENAPSVLYWTALFGALTALFGATVGAAQNDIKKVIAYSTCSQLGYMVLACGLQNFSLAVFHLYNHAFFKALLFLAAGAVIHAASDEQDMRRMGGFFRFLPVTYLMILVGSLSLMGVPFLTGFYSKDFIMENALVSPSSLFFYIAAVVAAFFTSYYSIRLILQVFIGQPAGYLNYYGNLHEPGPFMLIPLVVLFLATCFLGFASKDLFVGMGSTFFGPFISTSSGLSTSYLLAEFMHPFLKNIPFFLTVFAGFTAVIFYNSDAHYSTYCDTYVFLNRKWFFDIVYSSYLAFPFVRMSYFGFFKAVDKGVLEIAGPAGVVAVVDQFAKMVKNVQTGYIFDYLTYIVFALALLLAPFTFGLNFDDAYFVIGLPLLLCPWIVDNSDSDSTSEEDAEDI
jgi:NADH-ubiquinone oxidoreductase chain 5